MRNLTLALACALSSLVATGCRAAEKPVPVVAEIPFRWTPGQIEVQASFDGRPPIWCILDSGAEFSMLDEEVARR